jgi:hypothetical protein
VGFLRPGIHLLFVDLFPLRRHHEVEWLFVDLRAVQLGISVVGPSRSEDIDDRVGVASGSAEDP